MHIPKWLIAAAALLFVVLIAAVAFFLGRTTSPSPSAPVAVSAPGAESQASVTEASGGAIAQPLTTTTTATPSGTATQPPPLAATESPASSNMPAAAVDTSNVSGEARARVSAYFKQIEALQSGGPVGDPDAFAGTILQGAASGDFSGIDDLVRTAADAERRAAAIQPPSECADYHRMALTLLQESRTMIVTLRDGLKRNDTEALTSLGATAQTMKSRADSLASAEKALRARFGV